MILDLFEEVSGSRMMCNYYRFGGVVRDLTEGWEERAKYLAHDRLPRALDQLDELLTGNEIVKAPGRSVGYLSPQDLIALSVSGPMIRAAGVPYDIRKAEPYGIYDRFNFDIPTLPESDIFARYYIRLLEAARASRFSSRRCAIFRRARSWVAKAAIPSVPKKARPTPASKRPRVNLASLSSATTGPILSLSCAHRFINLNALGPMSVGYKIADAVVILGAIDIVLGEVDR